MAEQKATFSCIAYDEQTAAQFYQSVNEYLDKQAGINGCIISMLAFQLFAYSKLKQTQTDNDNEQKTQDIDANSRYLILRHANDDALNKQNIIAAVVQLEGVIFLSTFNNLDLSDATKLDDAVQVLCTHMNAIEDAKGLEICGDKPIIEALLKRLKLEQAARSDMEQNVYLCTNTKKYDEFCTQRIEKCKLKIDNVADKDREELFGHLVEAEEDNEVHVKLIKQWYPLFCADVGLKFKESGMNALIRNMKTKKVYFWGREKPKMIEKEKAAEQKQEQQQTNASEYDLVSLAAFTGYTPHMARIGFVYTPKAERRKGYATHLVGVLTQMMQKENKMVWIIADKKNVASNKAYTRIGFDLEATSMLTIFD
eukprot:CAMPEP_0197032942 /NCGR_PEP_ID=MMETSP1384-20130603/11479_1 /TAXON_ID=29189 /ORGANISM="Ammonia sp." /LENGTH=367 /DNA_ID=CAMNT_0042462673 /DNA_START=14 /DNA_END=1117 /DNA_ORIENTATION=+